MAKRSTTNGANGRPRTLTGTQRISPSATKGKANGKPQQVAISHDQIAERARAIWQSKGCPLGLDEANWYEAEVQLRMEQQARSARQTSKGQRGEPISHQMQA